MISDVKSLPNQKDQRRSLGAFLLQNSIKGRVKLKILIFAENTD